MNKSVWPMGIAFTRPCSRNKDRSSDRVSVMTRITIKATWAIMIGAAFLTVLVTIAQPAVPSTINQPLRVNTINKRYFDDGTGRAVLLSGSHTWQTIGVEEKNWKAPFDWNKWIAFLESYGHNFIRTWVMEQNTTTPSLFVESGGKHDLTKVNPAYLAILRASILDAQSHGFYVGVLLFRPDNAEVGNPWNENLYHINNNLNGINGDPNNDGWGYETYNNSITAIVNLQKTYVKTVIDYLNDLDNIIWEIGNEGDLSSAGWQNMMIQYIKTYEATKPKQHLVWGSCILDLDTWVGDDSYLSANADIIGPCKSEYGSAPPIWTGTRPMIIDTDHVSPYMPSPKEQWVIKTFMAGMHPILMDFYTYYTPDIYTVAEQEAMRKYMGYIITYANKMDLVNMTPSKTLSSTQYSLKHSSNNEFLIYQPGTGSFYVYLADMDGTYTVEWFRLSTGVASAGTDIQGGATRTMTPPTSGAYLLYLKRTQSPAAPTGLRIIGASGTMLIGTGATQTMQLGDDITARTAIMYYPMSTTQRT